MLAVLISIAQSTGVPITHWAHGWDTAAASWWGDFGYSLLDDQQAQFIAKNYAVASLEKCTGRGQGVDTEEGIYRTAKQLKAVNPDLKVMFYWHTGQAGISCYANNAVFMAHSEWWLRDDNGNVVRKGADSSHPDGQMQIDWTNQEAVQWWVSVPLNGTGADQLIDGVLADGAAFEVIPNISSTRLDSLYTAKLAMIEKLQARFDAVGRSGVVFGNGLNEYNQSPSDPHGRRIVESVGGVQNEHFAAFEQVDPKTGALRKDKVSDTLDNIEWASNLANHSKQVFCSFWAGPYTGFAKGGWPKYADDSQPCGATGPGPNCTQAQLHAGWRAELQKYLPFNLAAFLTVAGPNTWFTQAVWYEDHQGFFPCPDAQDTCTLPSDFYSAYLSKPLGAPHGPRQKVGDYKWTRSFAHAEVTLDLNNPLGGTSIVFH